MLLKLPAVIRETALSRSSIYAMIQEGRFPAPVRIGTRGVAWRSEEIDDWRQKLPRSLKIRAVGTQASI